MKPILITGVAVALSAAGLANDVAYAAGGYALTANDAADDLAHKITIHGNAATNHSGKTFTITGTNANGEPQTETIAGPNGVATKTSTKYFLSVTSITVDATTGADTFDMGWTADAVSPWSFINDTWQPPGLGFGCSVDSGSPTYGVEQQYGDGVAFTHATVTGETTAQEGGYTYPVRAIRLIWSAAGGVTLRAWY